MCNLFQHSFDKEKTPIKKLAFSISNFHTFFTPLHKWFEWRTCQMPVTSATQKIREAFYDNVLPYFLFDRVCQTLWTLWNKVFSRVNFVHLCLKKLYCKLVIVLTLCILCNNWSLLGSSWYLMSTLGAWCPFTQRRPSFLARIR